MPRRVYYETTKGQRDLAIHLANNLAKYVATIILDYLLK